MSLSLVNIFFVLMLMLLLLLMQWTEPLWAIREWNAVHSMLILDTMHNNFQLLFVYFFEHFRWLIQTRDCFTIFRIVNDCTYSCCVCVLSSMPLISFFVLTLCPFLSFSCVGTSFFSLQSKTASTDWRWRRSDWECKRERERKEMVFIVDDDDGGIELFVKLVSVMTKTATTFNLSKSLGLLIWSDCLQNQICSLYWSIMMLVEKSRHKNIPPKLIRLVYLCLRNAHGTQTLHDRHKCFTIDHFYSV